jgi:predicted transcriptional regulator
MPRQDKKHKLTVYLDPGLMAALADLSARRKHSLSLVAEAAIASFLSPDAEQRREAAFAKRLDRLDRRIGRLERDVVISNEAFALFMRSWLAAMPPSPDATQPAARAQAAVRYDQFLDALGRRLASGQTLRLEIAEDIAIPHGDRRDVR